MKKKPVIAIAGATGLVGNEMLSILEERKVPHRDIRLFASENSAGEVYKIGSEEAVVAILDDQSFEGVDLALFATSSKLSEQFVPIAAESGAVAIDNSSCFRMEPEIPLVVPEVNFDQVTSSTKIIANPNCSTIQLMPVLKALHRLAGLERVVVSTYQSVSGAGKHALDELWEQTRSVFSQQEIRCEAFAHQIAFNCIPHIDTMLDNGYTKEEAKVINESRKILGLPDLRITATAVRVPVFHSHAESLNVQTERECSVDEVLKALGDAEGVTVYPDYDDYPMQLGSGGTDDIHVGRIRIDESVDCGLALWVVADNLRKGAALNAVQIAERVIATFGE